MLTGGPSEFSSTKCLWGNSAPLHNESNDSHSNAPFCGDNHFMVFEKILTGMFLGDTKQVLV